MNKISAKKMSKHKDKLIFYIAMAALPMLQFIIFYIAVNTNSVLLAFKEYTIIDNELFSYKFVGFENFRLLLLDLVSGVDLIYAIKNSLIVFFTSIIVGIPLTLIFSYYIYKKFALSEFFKFVLFLPSIISSIVCVVIFKNFVANAVPAFIQEYFGIKTVSLLSRAQTKLPTIIFYNVWIGFGTGILMYSNAMSGISHSVVEYGQIDGVNNLQEFIHIIIPAIYPTIVTFLVVNVAGFFTNQANLVSFYGPYLTYEYRTIGYFLFQKVMADTTKMADYPYAAAAGVFFTFIAVPLTLSAKWLLEKVGPKEE